MSDYNPFDTHGAPSWLELMTTDTEAAKAFYGELFGWQMEDVPMEGMTYTLLKNADIQFGGLMTLPPEAEGAPPHWGNYITVDDTNAMASKVAALGGKVLIPPRDIPDVGRFSVIQDPQGAILSIISYFEKTHC
ncbi:VOC family protein [Corallincola platygyrae]|uniref:VOC family protein n=1 Tax=Corallincola platygyrae TaxID=1193278 RepID=A0ABW4XN24_9GAMM